MRGCGVSLLFQKPIKRLTLPAQEGNAPRLKKEKKIKDNL